MTAAELSIWVTAAATIATAIATVVLAGVTWLLFRSTQRMAAATSEPNVIATLEPNRWSFMHMDLLIENTGTGPAFDVQITFDPPLTRDRGGQQIALPLNAISILRPGQALRNHIGQGSSFLESAYRATVSWKGTAQSTRRTQTSYDISLRHYDGFSRLGGEAPPVQMAQELKKIREAMERLARGHNRLEVDVFTERERSEVRAERERWYNEAVAEAADGDEVTPSEETADPPP